MSDKAQQSSANGQGRPARRLKVILSLLLLGLALVSSAGIYLYCSFSLPVGNGPAGPRVEAQRFSRAWTQRPVLVVGFGDSVTAGFGASRGYGYFERLVSNPADEFLDMKGISLRSVFPRLHATNYSVSGTISLELADTQLARLPCQDAQTLGWLVITTGGNDLIHNYGRTPPRAEAMYGATFEQAEPWIESFEKRLGTIIEGLNSRFPGGCHIFLANIYDPTDGAGDIQKTGLPAWPDGMQVLTAYNDVIRRCAERHTNVHLVNLHDAFLGHGIHCSQFWSKHYDSKDPHYWYYSNLEDPNERGYDVVRRLFLIEMAKVAQNLKQ